MSSHVCAMRGHVYAIGCHIPWHKRDVARHKRDAAWHKRDLAWHQRDFFGPQRDILWPTRDVSWAKRDIPWPNTDCNRDYRDPWPGKRDCRSARDAPISTKVMRFPGKSPPQTPAQRQAKCRAIKRGEWHYCQEV